MLKIKKLQKPLANTMPCPISKLRGSPGSLFGFVGPNGAGKLRLLKLSADF